MHTDIGASLVSVGGWTGDLTGCVGSDQAGKNRSAILRILAVDVHVFDACLDIRFG